jgi:hypothetical protein
VTTALFWVTADAATTALEADAGRGRLLRMDAALAALAARPSGSTLPAPFLHLRIPVRCGDKNWLILWLAGPADDEVTSPTSGRTGELDPPGGDLTSTGFDFGPIQALMESQPL